MPNEEIDIDTDKWWKEKWVIIPMVLGVLIIGYIFVMSVFLMINPRLSENSQGNIVQKQINEEPQQIEEKLVEKEVLTINGVALKELYSYPDFGFYIFQADISRLEQVNWVNEIRNRLQYSDANWLNVYIFDKAPDLSRVKNAPKNLPANMILETQKLAPNYDLSVSKDFYITLCQKQENNTYNHYFTSGYFNWQWQTDIGDTANQCPKLSVKIDNPKTEKIIETTDSAIPSYIQEKQESKYETTLLDKFEEDFKQNGFNNLNTR